MYISHARTYLAHMYISNPLASSSFGLEPSKARAFNSRYGQPTICSAGMRVHTSALPEPLSFDSRPLKPREATTSCSTVTRVDCCSYCTQSLFERVRPRKTHIPASTSLDIPASASLAARSLLFTACLFGSVIGRPLDGGAMLPRSQRSDFR